MGIHDPATLGARLAVAGRSSRWLRPCLGRSAGVVERRLVACSGRSRPKALREARDAGWPIHWSRATHPAVPKIVLPQQSPLLAWASPADLRASPE